MEDIIIKAHITQKKKYMYMPIVHNYVGIIQTFFQKPNLTTTMGSKLKGKLNDNGKCMRVLEANNENDGET